MDLTLCPTLLTWCTSRLLSPSEQSKSPQATSSHTSRMLPLTHYAEMWITHHLHLFCGYLSRTMLNSTTVYPLPLGPKEQLPLHPIRAILFCSLDYFLEATHLKHYSIAHSKSPACIGIQPTRTPLIRGSTIQPSTCPCCVVGMPCPRFNQTPLHKLWETCWRKGNPSASAVFSLRCFLKRNQQRKVTFRELERRTQHLHIASPKFVNQRTTRWVVSSQDTTSR